MDVQRPPKYSTRDTLSETGSPQVIHQGITAIAQGDYSEGIALLVRARDTLILEQTQYLLLLNTIIQHYTRYTQAQEMLLHASRKFVQADSDLNASIVELKQLLPQNQSGGQTVNQPIIYLSVQKTSPIPITSTPIDQSACQEVDERTSGTTAEYLPALSITCFGRFEVRRHERVVTLCQNRNGQAIFRYLIAQSGYRATVDALIEAFWPNEEPGVARHKLQVAISALRCSLNAGYIYEPGGGYIFCRQHLYLLNPDAHLATDIDEFLHCYEVGRHAQEDEKVRLYEHACNLYTGPFLMEDRYTDWSIGRREQLSKVYLSMCLTLAEQALKHDVYENAISWANALLAENSCDESAHRLLMLTYTRQGRRNEAMKQYQRCERILFDELGVAPMPETVRLFQSIVTHVIQE